jgi:hypothetical protein
LAVVNLLEQGGHALRRIDEFDPHDAGSADAR